MNKKKKLLLYNWLNSGGGGSPAFTPADLGAKLKGWYESDGLVNNATNQYGVVASGRATQWSDLSGNENHFTVPVGTNAPQLSSGRLLFTKSNSESLYSPALLADCVTDIQGEIILVLRKTTGESCYGFTAYAAGNTDKRGAFGVIEGTPDRTIFQIKKTTAPLVVNQYLGNTLSDTQFITLSVSSNGTAYKVMREVDGERINETISSMALGSNNGDWWGDTTPGDFSLFSWLDSIPTFYTGSIYAAVVSSEQLSDQERSNVFCYLNNKYQVWP